MNKHFKTLVFLLVQLFSAQTVFCLPKLSSYPSAVATIYLDFDGQYVNASVWNMGNTINCLPSGMTDAQITEVFNRVAEDYRPLQINITTDSTVYISAPIFNRIRIIVTPTSNWYQGVGGIAYTGSFIWGDDTPAFVFCDRLGPNSTKMVAEACTHESGHTLGLAHQSKYDASCNLLELYNSGIGTGETSWAPVMGNSYYRNMTGWDNGPTQFDCSEKQDNLSIITTQNGFSYRPDDFKEDLGVNTFLINPAYVNINGVIATSTDKDAFKITLSQRNSLHITAKPFSIGANDNGANLDVRVLLYNATLKLLQTYDPVDMMSVSIDTVLNSGIYFLVIDGTGNRNTEDYGSLGSYTITGNIGSVLPIQNIKLSGIAQNSKHNLSWEIISNDPVKYINMEFSKDGIKYNTLSQINTNSYTVSYNSKDEKNIYYRLKVASSNDQIVYSNVIVLRSDVGKQKDFEISNVVKEVVIINAKVSYQYFISDINGRRTLSGKGLYGINKLNVGNLPAGLYLITLLSGNELFTQKILKQ